MSFTVLIAASERLAALQQQEDLTNAEAFADTDALKALDTIARRRPQVVALDQRFAASARGAAFINRIKADLTVAFATGARVALYLGDNTCMVSEMRLYPPS